jgi:hypothetical protein
MTGRFVLFLFFIFTSAAQAIAVVDKHVEDNAKKNNETSVPEEVQPKRECPKSFPAWHEYFKNMQQMTDIEEFTADLVFLKSCSLEEGADKFFAHACLKPALEIANYIEDTKKESEVDAELKQIILDSLPKEFLDKKFWNGNIKAEKNSVPEITKEGKKRISDALSKLNKPQAFAFYFTSQNPLNLKDESILLRHIMPDEKFETNEAGKSLIMRIPAKGGDIFMNSFTMEIPSAENEKNNEASEFVCQYIPKDPKQKLKYFRIEIPPSGDKKNDPALPDEKTKLSSDFVFTHSTSNTMNCTSCHQAGWIKIRPDPQEKSEFIYKGSQISNIDDVSLEFKNRHKNPRAVEPPMSVPSYGSDDEEFKTKYLDKCIGKKNEQIVRNVTSNTSCIDCHKGSRSDKPPRLVPIFGDTYNPGLASKIINHNIMSGVMPEDELKEKTMDNLYSRKILAECLHIEYFGRMSPFAKNRGVEWDGVLVKSIMKTPCPTN